MTQAVIHHFGPDPDYVGGMGSVLRVLTENRVGGDIVQLHPTWRPNSHRVNALLTVAAMRDIYRMGSADVAHIHVAEKGSFVREGALVLLARATGKVTVVTIHGADFLPFANRHPRLAARVLRGAHLVTCLDHDVLDLVRQSAPRSRAELLPNPVPMDSGSPGADHTQEIVLFAGEISHRKGADVLHRAWSAIAESRPNARCLMVGPAKDVLIPTTERLEVRAPVGAATMRELLRDARVVVLPSRAEAMPMILTEAMGGGRPFVSTPVGGIPELAQRGGVLVPVDDAAALAKCLLDFLSDPQLARKVGEEGRMFCSTTRSVEVVDARLRQLYHETTLSARLK